MFKPIHKVVILIVGKEVRTLKTIGIKIANVRRIIKLTPDGWDAATPSSTSVVDQRHDGNTTSTRKTMSLG